MKVKFATEQAKGKKENFFLTFCPEKTRHISACLLQIFYFPSQRNEIFPKAGITSENVLSL